MTPIRSGLEWAVHMTFRSGRVRIEGYSDVNTAHQVSRDLRCHGVKARVVAAPVLRGDWEWAEESDARA